MPETPQESTHFAIDLPQKQLKTWQVAWPTKLINSCQVALKICSPKTFSHDHSHYSPRSVSRKRCSLTKQLGLIKSIQDQLKSSFTSPKDSVVTVLEHNNENQPLCKAIMELNHLKYDHPLHSQLEELYFSTKETINYMDEI